ncbi:MAG: hypothetical protein QTN59_09910 [Candidatus Electrothrix communis]|nr:MAG: hypothetical protein QTN59_09910 [Candidatus Electrothrix communis]
MSDRKKNAIEQRLDALIDSWNEFAQESSDSCLLRWLVTADEARMIDVFLENENESCGQTPDLFLVFDVPFETPEQYSASLIISFNEQYEASKKILEEAGVDTHWIFSETELKKDDLERFINRCQSFKEHYTAILEQLVVVLIPESVSDVTSYERWLGELLLAPGNAALRFMIVDDIHSPLLSGLAQAYPDKVRTIIPNLDMPGALMELVQNVPGKGPDYRFRCHLVALTNSAEKGDLAAAQQAYMSALTIAQEEEWLQMQVVAHMALGAALLGAAKFQDALACYRQAEKVSEEAVKHNDPAGKKLLMQSRLACGAALISDGCFEDAAEIYEVTAPLALELKEQLMVLESWRMAAYCYEQNKQYSNAWNCALQALAAGEQMDAQERQTSTLSYALQALLRIAGYQQNQRARKEIEEKATVLLGPCWQDVLKGEVPSQ